VRILVLKEGVSNLQPIFDGKLKQAGAVVI
jgi:hypothetical protein